MVLNNAGEAPGGNQTREDPSHARKLQGNRLVRRSRPWRRRPRRRQERLAWRDGADFVGRGRARPAGFRHHRRRLLALRRRQRAALARDRFPGGAGRRQALAGRGRPRHPFGVPARRMADGNRRRDHQGVPRALQARRQDGSRRCRPLERDRRRPARSELRRPAGNLPQHPRREGPARCLPPLLCLALHRPRHRLPPGQAVRPHEGSPFPSASSRWCARTSAAPA